MAPLNRPLRSRNEVRKLVIMRIDPDAPNLPLRTLQAIRRIDAERVHAGGVIDILSTAGML